MNSTEAQAQYDKWLKANDAIIGGQSYVIDGITMNRANLSEIRRQVNYWAAQVNRLKLSESGGKMYSTPRFNG